MSEKITDLCKGKSVAIFGKAISALSAEKLLTHLGIKSVFYSENPDDKAEIFSAEKAKKHSLVILSPAFKPNHKWIKIAKENSLECIGEVDLSALAWKGDIVAISGTNGKTTSTAFLTKCFNAANIKAVAAGNIGIPLSEFCITSDNAKNSVAVVELSSFQISSLKYMHPSAYLWTNFSPDHLDWHSSMEEYFLAKKSLIDFLKNKLLFVGESVVEYAKANNIALPDFTKKISPEQNCPAPFDNNIQNENFSIIKAYWESIGMDKEILYSTAKDFSLAPYRFCISDKIGNVTFWNDSKGTNESATLAAINHLKGKKIIWIGGGKNKFCDITNLCQSVAQNCKYACLIGENASLLKEFFDKLNFPSAIFSTLKEAVPSAYNQALDSGEVLFSPGFSSFGMFKDYSHRGKCFENEVFDLKNLKNKE